MTFCTRHFLGLLLAFCALSAFATAPEAQTVACKVTGVYPDALNKTNEPFPDFYCKEGFHVTFYKLWTPPGNEEITYRKGRLLKQLLLDKTASIQIHISMLYPVYRGSYDDDRVATPVKAATVYLDGKDIGLELIKAGLALHAPSSKWPENPQYRAAQQTAQAQKVGLWADPAMSRSWSQTKDVTTKEEIDEQREYQFNRTLLFAYPIITVLLLVFAFVKLKWFEGVFVLLLVCATLPYYMISIIDFTSEFFLFRLIYIFSSVGAMYLAVPAGLAAIPLLIYIICNRIRSIYSKKPLPRKP